jgi:hypothetical protein
VKPGFNCFGLAYTTTQVWGYQQVVYQGSTCAVDDAVAQGWFGSTLFCYNPQSQSYDFRFVTSLLRPGKGFWLYSEIDGILVFSSTIPDTGTVCGIVTDLETANTLEGVLVSIGDISDTTNSSGEYCLYDVPIGQQTLVATREGFDDYTGPVNVPAGGEAQKDFSMDPFTSIHN